MPLRWRYASVYLCALILLVACSGSDTTQITQPAPGAPRILGITPDSSATSGGAALTIDGTGFASGATVEIGGSPATDVRVVSSTSITCDAPAGTVGLASVRVRNTDGMHDYAPNAFRYVDAPTIGSLTPAIGSVDGGTRVTVDGSGFQLGVRIEFDGVPTTDISVASPSRLTCTTPPHAAGQIAVTITNPDQRTATQNNAFEFALAPAIDVVAPPSGEIDGGSVVGIYGSGFEDGATVTIGGVAATGVTFLSATELRCTTPAGSIGTWDLVATNPDTLTATKTRAFSYVPLAGVNPAISSVSPTLACPGDTIQIYGSGFSTTGTTKVWFGRELVDNRTVLSTSQIRVVAPKGKGTVNIAVVNPMGTSITAVAALTYDGVPPTFAGATSTFAVSNRAADLRWASGSDNMTASTDLRYAVYRATSAASQDYDRPVLVTDPGETSVVVGGLESSRTYYFVVRARDKCGNEDGNTVEVSVTTPAAGGVSRWTAIADPLPGTDARYGHVAIPLHDGRLLVAGGTTGSTIVGHSHTLDVRTGKWSASTGALLAARTSAAAVQIRDARVLLIGGHDGTNTLASCEEYNPAANTWSAASSLATARGSTGARASVTVLRDGSVLVAGGQGATGMLASCELAPWVFTLGSWQSTGSMNTPRGEHCAAMLQDGKVLVAGGTSGTAALKSCEIYDPDAGTWSATGSLIEARSGASMTVLRDGRVVIRGGSSGTVLAEVYDPNTDKWAALTTATGTADRSRHGAALRPDGFLQTQGGSAPHTASGDVLEPHGLSMRTAAAHALAVPRRDGDLRVLWNGDLVMPAGVNPASSDRRAQIYKHAFGGTNTPPALNVGRRNHTSTLLPTGNVMVIGGRDDQGNLAAAPETWDPVSRANWSSGSASTGLDRENHTATLVEIKQSGVAGPHVLVTGGRNNTSSLNNFRLIRMNGSLALSGSFVARHSHTATLRNDGQVLLVGGDPTAAGTSVTGVCQVFNPATRTFSYVGGNSLIRRAEHRAVLLPTGFVLVAGGRGVGNAMITAAQRHSGAGGWIGSGTMTAPRRLHTLTVLADGRVLATGGHAVSGSVSPSASCEIFDPTDNTWTNVAAMNTARAEHTAILLPTGRVAVFGGITSGGGETNSIELYDPELNAWRAVGNLPTATARHAATMLPSGRVLLTGGSVPGTATVTTATLEWDEGLGHSDAWAPSIQTINNSSSWPVTISGVSNNITLDGARFVGMSDAASGRAGASSRATVVTAYGPIGGGGAARLHMASSTLVFSDGTRVIPSFPGLPKGYYLVRAIANGMYGRARLIRKP